MNPSDSGTERIRDLVKTFSTAMLITHRDDGGLHARPMAIADVAEDCTLWFVTGKSGGVAAEVAGDHAAHVVCQKDHSAYLSIAGTAALAQDRARVDELWREPFRVWFPGGKDDPNLVLISFRPERAEYWDNTGFNKIAYLWEAARAYVTGDTPAVKEGEQHGEVRLA